MPIRALTSQGHALRCYLYGVRKRPKASSVQCRSQQIAVAVLNHPPRASEVAVVDATGAFTILVRVEPEQRTNDFPPFRTFRGCIKEADVKHEVLAIIIGQA